MVESTIRFWCLPNNGWNTAPLLKIFLSDFERDHSGVRVEVTVKTAASLWRHLFLVLKRPDLIGEELKRPDVIQVPGYWTSALASFGLVQELSSIEPLSLELWSEFARPHCLLEGKPGIFSVPWWMEVWTLYYRKDVLAQAGLGPEILRSWDGVHQACKRIAARGPSDFYPVANHNPREAVSLTDVAPAIWSQGGDIFSKDGSRTLFHRQEVLTAVEKYAALLVNGWMPLLGRGGLAPRTIFDGSCALQFHGRIPEGGPPKRCGVARLPAMKKPVGLVNPFQLALFKGGSNPTLSYRLLRYLSSPVPARRYAAAIGAFSCLSGVPLVEEAALSEVYQAALESSRYLPNTVFASIFERIFDRSMENVIRRLLHGTYRPDTLRNELLRAGAEMDYISTAQLLQGAAV